MSIEINVEDCTAIVIEKHGDARKRWDTYTFINTKGQTVEVNVFHKSPITALNDKLSEFVEEFPSLTGA